jgi:hypothetical protein
MLGKIIGGAVKGAIGAVTGGKKGSKGRDNGKIENTLNNASNKARGTKWSPDEQKGYQLYKKMDPKGNPKKFNSLPKAERKMYIDNAKDLGHKKSSGPARAMAFADGFQSSSELSSKSKETPNLGNVLGGLASAFG